MALQVGSAQVVQSCISDTACITICYSFHILHSFALFGTSYGRKEMNTLQIYWLYWLEYCTYYDFHSNSQFTETLCILYLIINTFKAVLNHNDIDVVDNGCLAFMDGISGVCRCQTQFFF